MRKYRTTTLSLSLSFLSHLQRCLVKTLSTYSFPSEYNVLVQTHARRRMRFFLARARERKRVTKGESACARPCMQQTHVLSSRVTIPRRVFALASDIASAYAHLGSRITDCVGSRSGDAKRPYLRLIHHSRVKKKTADGDWRTEAKKREGRI